MQSLVIVLDVGKTMTKMTLWSRDGSLIARETRANQRIDAGQYISLDIAGIDLWMADTLLDFSRRGAIDAIIPVGHGAAAVVIRNGEILAPSVDYEEPIPERERSAYDKGRSPFEETGSPKLPNGLNLGVQLHRLEQLFPAMLFQGSTILTWPQFWAWRLSGVCASEVTSLGCHTDLWNPNSATPSGLAVSRGWAARFPPLRRAGEILGPVTSEWVTRAGLSPDTQVYCGLHDSNAALLAARAFPEIAGKEATVLSTGTWFVAMRSPKSGVRFVFPPLDEARDCLVNVDAAGTAIPSARFMGGREIELLTGSETPRIDIKPDQPSLVAAVSAVLQRGSHILPTFAPGFGPFPKAAGLWLEKPEAPDDRRAAICLYAALMTDVMLNLIGSKEHILVEGRFSEAEVFVRALASLRPADRVYRANSRNDVSFGALRLLDPTLRPTTALERIIPLDIDLISYRAAWLQHQHRQIV